MDKSRRMGEQRMSGILWVFVLLALCAECNAGFLQKIRDFFVSRSTCHTEQCHEAASMIKDNRNVSVLPCDDFYEFSCGGWIASNPVPQNTSTLDHFGILTIRTNKRIEQILLSEGTIEDSISLNKSRQIYKACLNSDDNAEKNIAYLVDLLAGWGGWPIASTNWNISKFDWTKVVVDLIRNLELSPLIHIDVAVDRKNSSKTVLRIDQAKMLFCPLLFHNGTLNEANKDALQNWIQKVALQIANLTNQNVSHEQITKDAEDLLMVDILLCKKQKGVAERSNEFELYNPHTVKQLQNLTDSAKGSSKMNWLTMLKDLVEGSEIEIDENYTVILVDKDYVTNLLSVIEQAAGPRAVANYILWQTIARLHPHISKEFRDMGIEYRNEILNGVIDDEPRWLYCVNFITQSMGHPIGYEYVKQFFDEDEKKQATGLVTDILESFVENLKRIDWMDEKTRGTAVEKAQNIAVEVGYPSWYDINNTTMFDDFYSKIAVKDSHIENKENLRLAEFRSSLCSMKEPFDRSMLFPNPALVNALYLPEVNMICIPAGIFQPPFYVKGRPEAMNYGAIGFIIAHEISHAFDVQGKVADKFGNLAEWWDQTIADTYKIKQECMVQQYSEYPLPYIANEKFKVVRLVGDTTVSENIADNGGLTQSFRAYKRYVQNHGAERKLPGLSEYSSEQLFYLGLAIAWCETSTAQSMVDDVLTDVHTPSKYRILIPLGNSEDFSKAWSCPQESEMKTKLTRTCQFW